MRKRCLSLVAMTSTGLASWMVALGTLAGPGIGDRIADFQQENPQTGIYFNVEGRPAMLYGKAFSRGATPEESAERFLNQHRGLFGDQIGELVPIERRDRPGILQGMMYNRDTGEYKHWMIDYQQQVQGVPVFRSSLQLLIRNEPGYPLVNAGGMVRDLTGLNMPANQNVGVEGAPDDQFQVTRRTQNRMMRNARRGLADSAQQVGEGELVIWAGLEGMIVEPRLAVQFIVETDINDLDTYENILFLADAQTGDILYQESLVHNVDINGNVSGNATEGWGADICADESPAGLPYAEVRVVGGNTAFADVNGDFVIPHGGGQQVTVESFIRGRWFEVFDRARGNQTPVLSLPVTPPGPANFLHNRDNNSELDRANVNAYIHANVVRDNVLFYAPDFPDIGTRQGMDVNTNINSNCNAFYSAGDNPSINFYTSGGGCSNTSNSTVVYHEYGHHLVARGSSGGQGAYGEGMSDTVAVVMTDQPWLAQGFRNNCNAPLRNADNNCQYDPQGGCTTNCGSGSHDCGRLLSGCVWSYRNELIQTEPQDYLDILRQQTYESIRRHDFPGIDPRITIHFLDLDDDDEDIGNGTPHYHEIAAAFGAHNMDAPPLQLIGFEFPNGRPDFVSPGGGTSMRVVVNPLSVEPQPGTGILHVNRGSGYEEFPMQEISDNVYDAIFPPSTCGIELRYYVSAETVDGDMVTSPANAPQTFFSAISGSGIGDPVFEDNFQTDTGWTVQNIDLVTGAWERADPVSSMGAPPSDHDGSGFCYVTDNRPGNFDVDGGPTILTSPRFDLSDGRGYIVGYARWFYDATQNNDALEVQVSNNNGATWVTAERVTQHLSAWVESEFNVSSYVTPTANVRVRFSVADNPNNSYLEAGIDAFKIEPIECGGAIAELTDLDILDGTIISGGLNRIRNSDNLYLVVEARVTGEANQTHLMRALVGATSGTAAPTGMTVSVESSISDVNGDVTLFLRNWNNNNQVQVGSYTIGMTEETHSFDITNPARFVRGSDDRIELIIRKIVLLPFTLNGFHSFIDHVEIATQ